MTVAGHIWLCNVSRHSLLRRDFTRTATANGIAAWDPPFGRSWERYKRPNDYLVNHHGRVSPIFFAAWVVVLWNSWDWEGGLLR